MLKSIWYITHKLCNPLVRLLDSSISNWGKSICFTSEICRENGEVDENILSLPFSRFYAIFFWFVLIIWVISRWCNMSSAGCRESFLARGRSMRSTYVLWRRRISCPDKTPPSCLEINRPYRSLWGRRTTMLPSLRKATGNQLQTTRSSSALGW